MGFFRRARDTKTLAGRRTAAAADVQDARVLPVTLVAEAAETVETRTLTGATVLNESGMDEAGLDGLDAVTVEIPAAKTLGPLDATLAATGVNVRVEREEYDAADDSDVFVARLDGATPATPAAGTAGGTTVTLFVYGWDQVQPGPLSWVFPSLRTALDAVKTMRNAVEWCICSGESWDDVDSARAEGAVLIEQLP